MSNLTPAVVTVNDDTVLKPANRNRGANYRAHAAHFLTRFPIGSELTYDQFSAWAYERGLLESLPAHGVARNSNEWLAHLQLRHLARQKVSGAGSHPDMREFSHEPFSIASTGENLLRVMGADEAIERESRKVPIRQLSLLTHHRKKLRYLRESVDFEQMLPVVRMQVEALENNISAFEERLAFEAKHLERQFAMIQHNVRLSVERGELVPANGGIRKLLEAPETGERWREYNRICAERSERPTHAGFRDWLNA